VNITADAVKQLRERTGAGMMECKKALVETKGDLDAAAELMRKQGLAKAGNWRVRHSSLQLAWRWLKFQKGSALAQWYRQRTADGRGDTRKTMIVALARKILIALWRYVTTGELPAGVVLKPVAI